MSDDEDPPDRLVEIFNDANAMSPGEERQRFVAMACGSDATLRDEVDALLAAHGRAGEFMRSGSGETADGPRSPAKAHDRIGPYTLLEKIGEGGFGVVWEAEQIQPVKRRVALKIIKPGMDSGQVISRFDAERQALALMDHPNIAKVLDAGTTDTGRPYFVMELVKGVAITEYCDNELLTPHRRLDLFVPVCEAVQHAHQKGIIHRDLKPSNVLVALYDGKPVPKVIDFGVAKATGPNLTAATLNTRLGQIVGTPEYMSPEQAELNQPDIDTRSDIYSLGAVLYELLTGTPPMARKRLTEAAFLEILRVIREDEPPKPSTRLSSSEELPSVAARRSVEPAKLTKLVRVDLDWIVMKALEKDRNRRYETANGLAMDIRRYLADEPVTACPPSAWYRMQKFFRRNRLPAIAAAAVAAVLVAGVTGTTIGLIGESRQRELAEKKSGEALRQKAEADDARAQSEMVIKFLTEEILGSATSERLPDKTVRDKVIEVMIDPAAGKISDVFKEKPTVEATMHQVLARIYESTGRGNLALPQAEKALAIRRRALPALHPATLETLSFLGSVLRNVRRHDEAEPLAREALAGNRQIHGDDDPATIESMNSLAILLQAMGKSGEAATLLREALVCSRRSQGDDGALTIMTLNNLGNLLLYSGKLDEAEPLVSEALDRARRVFTDNDRRTLRAMNNMSAFLREKGKFTDAEQMMRKSLKGSRDVLGDDHPETLQAVSDMGSLLADERKFDEAEPLVHEALDGRKRILGEDNPDTLTSLNNLGVFLFRWGKMDEAEPVIRDAVQQNERRLSEDHVNTLYALRNLGDFLRAKKNLGEAEEVFRKLIERGGPVFPPDHQLRFHALYNLGEVLYEQNKFDEAVSQIRVLLSAYQQTFTNEHVRVVEARIDLGRVLIKLSKYREAETELLEADRVLAVAKGVTPRHRQRCIQTLVRLYDAWDISDPGKGFDAKAATWREKYPGRSDPAEQKTQ